MGNELQTAAVKKLYSMSDRVNRCNSEALLRDWVYLQSSDHFYYMSTKFFSDGAVHAYFNPYENPYQAFMNYMNVLSDFELRLAKVCPIDDHSEEVNRLSESIQSKDHLIEELYKKLTKLEKKVGPAKRRTASLSEKSSARIAAKKAVPAKAESKTPPKTVAKKPAATKPATKAAAKKPAATKPATKKPITGKTAGEETTPKK